MATDTASETNTGFAGVEGTASELEIGKYKAVVQDVLDFLKSGHKPPPAHLANLDKIARKNVFTRCQNFHETLNLSDTLYYVGKQSKKFENQSVANRIKVLFTREEVFDKDLKKRIYVDSLISGQMSAPKDKALMNHINKMSDLVDVKTGWKTQEWPCTQPGHCKQLDSYNCGVYVCHFARCLVQDLNMTKKVDTNNERKRIFSSICGSCYDDVSSGRSTAVCKICRKDDSDDWLGCDRCGQFIHASCLGVDFAKAISEYFYCY